MPHIYFNKKTIISCLQKNVWVIMIYDHYVNELMRTIETKASNKYKRYNTRYRIIARCDLVLRNDVFMEISVVYSKKSWHDVVIYKLVWQFLRYFVLKAISMFSPYSSICQKHACEPQSFPNDMNRRMIFLSLHAWVMTMG